MLVQCWASVVDDGPTLALHWVDVSCPLGNSDLVLFSWCSLPTYLPVTPVSQCFSAFTFTHVFFLESSKYDSESNACLTLAQRVPTLSQDWFNVPCFLVNCHIVYRCSIQQHKSYYLFYQKKLLIFKYWISHSNVILNIIISLFWWAARIECKSFC